MIFDTKFHVSFAQTGVIFNSPRCVRSVIECIKKTPLKGEWRNLKCFVVGEATGKLVKSELNLKYEGESSGNLCNLLQEISNCMMNFIINVFIKFHVILIFFLSLEQMNLKNHF